MMLERELPPFLLFAPILAMFAVYLGCYDREVHDKRISMGYIVVNIIVYSNHYHICPAPGDIWLMSRKEEDV